MERFRFLSATQGVESGPRTLRAGHYLFRAGQRN
jgi:hypothetical protein